MLVTVTFEWDDRHGNCYECGRPAAYDVIDAYGPGRHMRVCSICAATHAAESGASIRWLFEEAV